MFGESRVHRQGERLQLSVLFCLAAEALGAFSELPLLSGRCHCTQSGPAAPGSRGQQRDGPREPANRNVCCQTGHPMPLLLEKRQEINTKTRRTSHPEPKPNSAALGGALKSSSVLTAARKSYT